MAKIKPDLAYNYLVYLDFFSQNLIKIKALLTQIWNSNHM